MPGVVLFVWLVSAGVGVFLIALGVRLGTAPIMDELKSMRIILEDLHDQYSVDAGDEPDIG